MKSEQIIRITSDKYHVTGTLEDYGVVIKLHFDYRGVSRTVGISRPLHESLADKSLEMMEAAIEQFSDPSKVALHYWYIDQDNEKRIAHGLVTGHPRVEDTTKIHTSPIQNISVDYDAEEALIETKNRIYHCPLSYCKFRKQDMNPDLLPDYTTLKENYSNRIKNPEIEHGKVLLVLSDFDDCYFNCLCVKDETGKVEHYETYNHIGMFQDNRMLQNTFSEEIAWFRVTFREINERRIVLLNNTIVFSTPYQITDNDNFRIDQDMPLISLFEWMMEQIQVRIRMMQEGGYDDWIQGHLSYRCRTGEIDKIHSGRFVRSCGKSSMVI